MQSKICPTCKVDKPLKDFIKPYPIYCKHCTAKRNRDWRHRKRAEYLALHPKPIKSERTEKSCRRCKEVKPLDAFYKQGKALGSYCKPCCVLNSQEIRARRGPNYRKAETLKYKCERMGTTPDWFTRTLAAQNGVCAICKTAETHPIKRGSTKVRSLAIDHDHATGKPRGLLCFRCNTSVHLLDKFGAEWLKQAAAYLRI